MSAVRDIWFSAQEIAEAGLPGLPRSKRGVALLAARLGWDGRARRRDGRGGGLEYPVDLFPLEAQRVLLPHADSSAPDHRLDAVRTAHAYHRAGHSKSAAVREASFAHGVSESSVWRWLSAVEGAPENTWLARLTDAPEAARAGMEAASELALSDEARARGLAEFERLRPEQREMAEARGAVLRAVAALAAATGLSMKQAREIFAGAWNAGEDDFGLGAETRELIARVSAPSLRRWDSDFAQGGLAALAPKWGQHRKGRGAIEKGSEAAVLIEGMLVTHPECSAKLVMRALRARLTEGVPSQRTVQRWIERWKSENAALALMAASPDGYRSKARLVAGRADESVLRLNQRWEMDSTPNDVMLSDGKRHALIGCIDVYSRRVKLLVARTSNSAAVAGCLRKALLGWGVPELLKTDNGSDYASKHIARVVLGLGIEQRFCTPFQPQEKPHIERFFHTFSHDLASLLPGFIGHNVLERKQIEDRKAFAARIMDRDAQPVELGMTAEELQQFCDEWCEAIYEREEHSGVGTTPFAKAQGWQQPVRAVQDERALDILLMPAPGDSGTRTVTKRGVQIETWHYTDPALIHHFRRRVQVRLDEADWGRVLVLSEDGEFICWALCPERAGVSRAEAAAHLRKDGREIESAYRKRIAEAKKASRAATVAADIIGKAKADVGMVVPFPAPTPAAHQTAALESASKAAASRNTPRLIEKRGDVSTAEIAALDAARPAKAVEKPGERFVRWQGIDGKVSAGETVGDAETRFWRAYPRSPEYAALVEMIEEYGAEAVLGAALPTGRDSAG